MHEDFVLSQSALLTISWSDIFVMVQTNIYKYNKTIRLDRIDEVNFIPSQFYIVLIKATSLNILLGQLKYDSCHC